MGFILRGYTWDIPILIFPYVLFSGTMFGVSGDGLRLTKTQKVCRTIAFYRCWAIVLPTLGG